jgi:geranylgeranyl pyrophosphate synthase
VKNFSLKQIEIDFESYLKRRLEEVPHELKSPSIYALFSGGKRIRPRLIFSILLDFDINPKISYPIAAGLELLHSASLIHDDLPALDNDDLRRGRPSLHKQFTESTAILTGDFLISYAFNTIIKECSQRDLLPRIVEIISVAFCDLCRGQELDMRPSKSITELKKIHELKTGALFASCFELAALIVSYMTSKNLVNLNTYKSFGTKFGLLFQYIDDYLDVYGSAMLTGKLESADLRNNKLSQFTSGDLAKGQAEIRALKKEIETALISMHVAESDNLKGIINEIWKRFKNIDEIRKVENL